MHHPQAIEETNRQFVEALGRGDAAGCAIVYTPGARLLPPDGSMVQGRQAIAAYWEAMMATGVRAVERETVSYEESGDMAREIGVARLHVEAADGTTTLQPAKYVVVWKQDAPNTWKWDVHIWNHTPLPTE